MLGSLRRPKRTRTRSERRAIWPESRGQGAPRAEDFASSDDSHALDEEDVDEVPSASEDGREPLLPIFSAAHLGRTTSCIVCKAPVSMR
jgi:hypothetical protein